MENKSSPFAENFRICCSESYSGRVSEFCRSDPAYIEAGNESDILHHTIADKLGDDRALILDYELAMNASLAAQDDFIYQQGFQDCVYLLRWIGMI